MKKLLQGTLNLMVLLMVFIGIPCIGGTIETHYTREGQVVAAGLVEDTQGELWEVDTDKFEIGDNVKMLIFTNCTDNTIYDDEIEKLYLKK